MKRARQVCHAMATYKTIQCLTKLPAVVSEWLSCCAAEHKVAGSISSSTHESSEQSHEVRVRGGVVMQLLWVLVDIYPFYLEDVD